MFPLFIDLFTKLFINGHLDGARRFLAKHEPMFVDESHKLLISGCHTTLAENHLNATLESFNECKRKISIDEQCHNYLFNFLQGLTGQNLLPEYLPKYFDLNWCFRADPGGKLGSSGPEILGLGGKEIDEKELITKRAQFDRAFGSLSELNPPMPRCCIGYLEGRNPCCVDIRDDTKYFAAGFENSEIHVWSLSAPNLGKISNFQQTSGIESRDSGSAFLRLESPVISAENRLVDEVINGNCMQNSASVMDIGSADISPSGAAILRGHSGPVHDLKFIPNSQLLISCSQDCNVRLWDLDISKNIFLYSGHLYPVWCIDCSPLELYFVTGSKDTTSRLWAFDRLSPIRIFAGHNMSVDAVKFHPNASYVATGSCDKTVSMTFTE